MPRNSRSPRLPSNPNPATRLFLRRLERAGLDVFQKLSASHWETIYRLEAGDSQVELVIRGGAR